MFFLVRRLFKQLLATALIGFVIRKAMTSENPRVKQVGYQANRLVGGVFAPDESGHRGPRLGRVGRSAGSALVGGAISYFFDPQQGYDRRARVKAFASDRMHRNREPLALPRGQYEVPAAGVERAVPRAATG
jgi:hypothetical protein